MQKHTNHPYPIGIVEGFYGDAYSHEARLDLISTFGNRKLDFYIYAPKADTTLRENFKQPFTFTQIKNLETLAKYCQKNSINLGVGISPIHEVMSFDQETWEMTCEKIKTIEKSGANILGLFFDDIQGDNPNLLQAQIKWTHKIKETFPKLNLLFCPTYYSNDKVLDKIFGSRPENYLKYLGKNLDPSIPIIWTGEKILGGKFNIDHTLEINQKLGRKIFFWDNYPVNDTPSISKFLNLEPLPYQYDALKDNLSGHMVNPMSYPTLSKFAIHSFVDLYQKREDYKPNESLKNALAEISNEKLKSLFHQYSKELKKTGIECFSQDQRERLKIDLATHMDQQTSEFLIWLNQSQNQSSFAPEVSQ